MVKKVWQLKHPHPPKNIDQLIEIILRNRNISDSQAIFNPSVNQIQYDIPAIKPITEKVLQAIADQKTIVVFGDYDVDGLCATTIMWETIHYLGGKVFPYIPHREKEGYGLSSRALENVISKHQPHLIITVDCGISSVNEVKTALSQCIDVIITDHHNKPAELPDCLIFHDHHVCGAMVAQKLSASLLANQPTVLPYSDHLGLAALGTICDILPLSIENRAIVIEGLKQITQTNRPGIVALCQTAGIKQSELSPYHFGFTLGPRLNAQGRLDHAMQALRLLCTKDRSKALAIAQELQITNLQRQDLTKELTSQAIAMAESQADAKLLVIGSSEWNPGIIGLIASQLVKSFYKPSIVWGSSAGDSQILKASARSIEGFHITEAIRQHQSLLLGHGGHPMAAGFSILSEKLHDFTKLIHESTNQILTNELLTPKLELDAPLESIHITSELLENLARLAPFGSEFREPIFQINDAQILSAKILGKEGKHLKLSLSTNNQDVHEAIYWQHGHLIDTLPSNVTIASRIESNTWQGITKPQLTIVDMQMS